MKPNDKAIEAAIRYLEAPMSAREQMEQILTAAYAAQFQSEEYAGLIEWLRNKAESLSEIYPPEAEAADALEAVLAEREMLREENENIKAANRYGKDWVDQASQDIASLRAERDALAARLAPVDDEALVEIAAVYCSPEMNWE